MTAHLFQCPACGAPLLPKGSAATLSCPYCYASVVVPEALRQAAGEAAWPTRLFDSFNNNDSHWLVGNRPGDEYFAKITQTIADGRYRWEAQTARASSLSTAWLTGYNVADFHLVVNCKHIRGSRAGSSWGVLFRVQDNHNFYWLRLTDAQQFAFSVVEAQQWLNLIEWTRADAIKPYGINQLEVVAYQNHFTFLINGQVVSEIEAEHFSQGLTGLAIEAYTLGEETTFDFMDFLLRTP